MTIKKPMYDILICLCVLAFIGGFVAQTPGIPQDARGYPIFLMCASAVLAVLLLLRASKALRTAEALDPGPDFKQQLLTIVTYGLLIGAYIFLLDKIGYVLSTILFVVVSLVFLKMRGWKLLVLLPLGLTFSMYLMFTKLLLITLPRGTWIAIGF